MVKKLKINWRKKHAAHRHLLENWWKFFPTSILLKDSRADLQYSLTIKFRNINGAFIEFQFACILIGKSKAPMKPTKMYSTHTLVV